MSSFNTFLKRGVAILFAAVLFGAAVIISIEEFINEYETGTIVGDIDLSGKKKNDVNNSIIIGVNEYVADFYVNVEFNNKIYNLSSEIVQFDLSDTVSRISNGSRSQITYNIDRTLLEDELESYIDMKFINIMNIDEIEATIERSLLDQDPFTKLDLHNYIDDITVLYSTINSYIYYDLSGENLFRDIDEGVFLVDPNDRFSFLNNTHELFLTSKEFSYIATGIQAVTIDTNFTSFIKSNHRSAEGSTGYELDIYDTYINIAQQKDFSFFNPYNFGYELRYEKVDNYIRFTLVGIPFDEEYTHKVTTEILEYQILEGNIPTIGKDGVSYEVTRYIERNGISLLDEKLYTNFYAPINEIN